MVSAVFHSPLEAAAQAQAAAIVKPPKAAAVPAAPAAAPSPPMPSIDWRGWAVKLLAPIAGIALLVGVWALLTIKGGSFPTPAATFDEALKVFSDPFYRNGPNDQGIGWNILFSLQRVASASAWRPRWASRWAS
jgi:nitrate/nitrite transport system permease protein